MSDNNKLVEVAVTFDTTTDKAVCVKDKWNLDGVWIPRSQIKYMRKNPNQTGVIRVPLWLAEKKGLDYED